MEAPSTTHFAFFYGIPRLKNFVASCDVRRVRCEVLRDKLCGATCSVELCDKLCGATCSVELRARRCAISCAVLPVARCCAISYVVTLFKVTRVRCKTLEGV